ncbi:MAG: hypothetical protein WC454_00225 [Phycisphaerae bacterium]
MKNRNVLMRCFCSVLALLLVTHFNRPASGQPQNQEKPTITITSVPSDPPGENVASEPIKGTVNGGNTREYKVVIYALNGYKWYIQPYMASPYTNIGDDGKWESKTHGGTEFAALLVKPSYTPNASLEAIPDVGGEIVDIAKKKPERKSE